LIEYFDLILMDLQMPVMDGYQATEQIRQHNNYHRTPIIALTANVTTADITRCKQVGMNDVLAKPLTRDALLRALTRWLDFAPAEDNFSPVAPSVADFNPDGRSAPIDYAQALEEFNYDKELLYEIIDSFIESTRKRLSKIQKCLVQGDEKQIRAEAHGVRGAAEYLFANSLKDSAAKVEGWEIDESGRPISAAVDEMKSDFSVFCEFVDSLKQT